MPEIRSGLMCFRAGLVSGAITDAAQLADLGRRLAGADRVVVVAGSGVAGLLLTAHLGRSAGTVVVLVAGRPPCHRRLVAGCTLRWSALQRMAHAVRVDLETLVDLIGRPGTFTGLAITRGTTGRRLAGGNPAKPIGLSTRHDHLLGVLRSCLRPEPGVVVIDGDVATGEALSNGELPLVVAGEQAALPLPAGRTTVLNATPNAQLLWPSRRTPEPAQYIAAVQAPLVPVGKAPRAGIGVTTLTRGPQMGFFTPFHDPEIPDASWYGINTMAVPAREVGTSAVSDRLAELEDWLGFAEVDPGSTRFAGIVPVVRHPEPVAARLLDNGTPVVDIHRSLGPGSPAINVDGMLAESIGTEAFATAFTASQATPAIAARDALVAADRSLRSLRRRNRLAHLTFFDAPTPVQAAVPWIPPGLWSAMVRDWAKL